MITEVVIMMGYPGSGKSTLAENLFGGNNNYIILHGDDLKTGVKLLKAAKKQLECGKSVVIDATNPSVEKRAPYVNLAKEFGITCRCIHVSTSFDESWKRNNCRERVVPKIVYYTYRKRFEEPRVIEGFTLE